MILVGDIGGTHTRLALFENNKLVDIEVLASNDFPNFISTLKVYLKKHPQKKLSKACFAVAGPVVNGVCKVTNLPWVVDQKELGSFLSLKDVFVINDLEALAHAVLILPKTSLISLTPNKSDFNGNKALLAPGTGLGESAIFFDGEKYHPFASEGGNADFAPITDLQREFSSYLSRHFDHPSYERALSGPGLQNIFLFLAEKNPQKLSNELKQKSQQGGFSRLITELGLAKQSPLCEEAIDLFTTFLGQESSNLALKFMTFGGVYLGGGIVSHILPKLESPLFKEAFLNKGRFRPLLENIPIYVVVDDLASLLGSAAFAS